MLSKLKSWQEDHRVSGYHIERLSGGQVRPYGPTVYKYIIIDLIKNRRIELVKTYCSKIVHRADDPKIHDLTIHVRKFKQVAPCTYYYECGHDYTG